MSGFALAVQQPIPKNKAQSLAVIPQTLPPQLQGIESYPRPTVSTREYFKDKPQANTITIPMNVGVEAHDGTIYSIWEIEYQKAHGNIIQLKNWYDEIVNGSDGDDRYTYYDQDTQFGLLGTQGNRNNIDGEQITLRWDMTAVAVRTLDGDDGKIIDAETGVMYNNVGELFGTPLESYAQNVILQPIYDMMHDIIHDGGKWYLLPNHQPMSSFRFLASLKGYKITDGVFNVYGEYDYDRDVQEAFLAWLAGKVQQLTSVRYTSTYDVTEVKLTHLGGGVLEYLIPKNRPLNKKEYPKNYDAIKDLWLNRMQLDLMMDVMVLKGFQVTSSDWYKKSIYILTVPTNWAKTTLLLNTLEKLNLATEVSLSDLVNTIGNTGTKGSVSLKELQQFALVVSDEASDINEIPNEIASDALKRIATGKVNGDSKNEKMIRIVFPMYAMFARDNIESRLQELASNDELDTRTLFPKTDKRTAKEYFANYNENEVSDSLYCLIYDMFYERYNKVKNMSEAERVEWADDTIQVNEGDFDRKAKREHSKVTHLRVLAEMMAVSISHPIDETGFTVEADHDYNPLVHIGRSRPSKQGITNFALRSPFQANKGIYGFLSSVLNEDKHSFKAVKRAKEENLFNCMAYTERSTLYFVKSVQEVPNKDSEFTYHNLKIPFSVPMLEDKIGMSIDDIKEIVTQPHLLQAIEDKDITPFLTEVSKQDRPSPMSNTIIAVLVKTWTDTETEEKIYQGVGNECSF